MEPIYSPISKKPKLCTEQTKNNGEEEEDRISNLPKLVLHHILSFLHMKHAVQTSILSRTWRNLWISLPVLNLTCNLFIGKWDEFKDFVDQVLILRDGSNIETFYLTSVRLFYHLDIQSRLSTWILTALRHNVQDLYLQIKVDEDFVLPQCIFTCESLTSLNLESSKSPIKLKLPDSMSLPRLKKLDLGCVLFEGDDVLNKIFSHCPVLESLSISEGEFTQKNLDISALTLKHLALLDCDNNTEYIHVEDHSVKLYAPNLVSFHCRDLMSKDYSIENLSCLVKAEIDEAIENYDKKDGKLRLDVDDETRKICAERMMKFLIALYNVEVLKLSAWFIKVVSGAPALLESTQIQLCNLRSLKLETWFSSNCVESITYLLKISPNIESLFLEITQDARLHPIYPYWDEVWFNSAKIEAYWEAGVTWQCFLHHLKFVEIRGVQGRLNELMFLENLLKNAMVMEKLVLFTSKEKSSTESRLIKFTEKLLTFPRASSSIAILFF